MEKNDQITGYWNADNLPGIRNHVAILGLSPFCSQAVKHISEQVAGTVPLPQLHGRNELGENLHKFNTAMMNLSLNPNINALLVVGYEPKATKTFIEDFKRRSRKPVDSVVILESGGLLEAVKNGSKKSLELVIQASENKREPIHLSDLVVGVKCGGSDATSGIVSNPATGKLADHIIDAGGTVIFSETTEIVGAEHILEKRAANNDVARKIIEAARGNEEIAKRAGIDLIGINPVPDNIAGGISTIEEKSLGAILKSGTRKISDVIGYAEIPKGKGLYFMDSPSAAHEVLTALTAAGSQLVIFSTGTGNPSGGPGVTPIIKVTGNPRTASFMFDHIDVDISQVLLGSMDIDDAYNSIYNTMVKVVNGKVTRGEALKSWDFSPIPTGL